MRLRKVPGSREKAAASPLVFAEDRATAQQGKWAELFGRTAPLVLEVGMGRGRFLATVAEVQPENNYLGLELREEMVVEALEKAEPLNLANLRYLWLNAELLPEIFAKGEVDRIYVHFPDPWPKSRHAKRRLTAPAFLKRYSQILSAKGELIFKTDDEPLFRYSQQTFREEGWRVQEEYEDLPLEKSGVITEYEGRWRRHGKPIFFLRALPPLAAEGAAEADATEQ